MVEITYHKEEDYFIPDLYLDILLDFCKQLFYNVRRIYRDWKWYYE